MGIVETAIRPTAAIVGESAFQITTEKPRANALADLPRTRLAFSGDKAGSSGPDLAEIRFVPAS